MPRDWKVSIVVPIYKKDDPEKVENYREISLLCTAYKVYAEVLRTRIERDCDEIGIIPESQGGFRKGRGMMDNVFVMTHLIQREKKLKDGKVYAAFIDLKAAFDSVSREKLWGLMEKHGINKEWIRRVKKGYEETLTVIRTEEGLIEEFETRKGLRQGCVLSHYFLIYS